MSRDAAEMAKKWAAHNEQRFIHIGSKCRKPKSDGTGRNTSYHGSSFVSYRTQIACYLTNLKTEKRYVVVTSCRYSKTTDDHMEQVRAHAFVPVFTVPILAGDYESVCRNADYLFNEARKFAETCKEKWRADRGVFMDGSWQAELTRLSNIGYDYVIASGWVYSVPFGLNDTIEDVAAYRKMKLDYFNHPNNVRKRERALARRLAVEVIGD